jgi:transcriptional regulator with XRE-family HTH domain
MNRAIIIGKRIKRLREDADLTQVELARLIGLRSSGIISQVENGERGLKGENLSRAAAVFGVEEFVLTIDLDTPDEYVSIVTDLMRLIKKKNKTEEDKVNLRIVKMTLEHHT